MKYPKAIEQLSATGELPETYLELLVKKAQISQRRKLNVALDSRNGNGIAHKSHWANRTGDFEDEELQKGPKYWHGQKPVMNGSVSVQTHQDFLNALTAIVTGEKDYHEYHGVTGIHRQRLRLAQSLRDKGEAPKVSDILRFSADEIRAKLGFGKARFGKVLV